MPEENKIKSEPTLAEERREEIIASEIEGMAAEDLAVELIKRLHFAIQKMEMYGGSHPIAQESLKQAYEFFREMLQRRPAITLSSGEDGAILIDDLSMPKSYFTDRFCSDFDRHRIQSLTFYRKLTYNDLFFLLKYLERNIGRPDERLPIADYLEENKIRTIEANLVKYRRVIGDEEQEDPRFFRRDTVENLFADHPEIIASLIGADSEDARKIAGDLADVMPSIKEKIGQDEVIDKVIRRIQQQSSGEGSDSDKGIQSVIEDLSRSLSEREKEELKGRLENIREEMIIDREDRTAEYLEDKRTLKRVALTKEIEEYIHLLQEGSDPEKLEKRLRSLLSSVLADADEKDVENLYQLLLRNFERTPLPALLGTTETLMKVLFEKAHDNVIRGFATERIRDKRDEKSHNFSADFLTTLLVWITVGYLARGKLLPSLRIARTYQAKKSDHELPEELIDDAKTYFASLSVGEPLQALISTLDGNEFRVPPEIKELAKLVDSGRIAESILERMSNRDRNYSMKAAEVLKPLGRKAAWVFANEVRSLPETPRDKAGNLPSDVLRRKEAGAMIVLAIISGEVALPILTEAVEDTDPAVRFAALEAISRVQTPRATKLLVKYLYSKGGQLEGDVLRLLPRMDPATAIPLLEKFFYARSDKWVEIIETVGQLGGRDARAFLLDTLDTWTFYIDGKDPMGKQKFTLALLKAIGKLPPDDELIRALKLFVKEWRSQDVVKGLAGMLNLRSDRVVERVHKILSNWKSAKEEEEN